MFGPQCLESNPNMTGEFASMYSHWPYLSGVFSEGKSSSRAVQGSTANTGVAFNASDGNAIYSGDKLQASALQALACIKI